MSANAPSSASWAPSEPVEVIFAERSVLAGILLGAVTYGVNATLFFITMKLLWGKRRGQWRDNIWIGYIVLLFALTSAANGTQFKYAQMVYIDNRNYPSGPFGYLVAQNAREPTMGSIEYMLANWLQDGLILWRFWVIFDRSLLWTALPALGLIGDIGSSLALMMILTVKRDAVFSPLGTRLLTAYYSLSVALNVLITLAIATKLLFRRHHLRRFGQSDDVHLSVAAMLIESAFIYSATGIAFIVPFATGSSVSHIFLPILSQTQTLAPLLIIMRVAQGQVWSANTAAHYATTTTVRFGQGAKHEITDIELDTQATGNHDHDSTTRIDMFNSPHESSWERDAPVQKGKPVV